MPVSDDLKAISSVENCKKIFSLSTSQYPLSTPQWPHRVIFVFANIYTFLKSAHLLLFSIIARYKSGFKSHFDTK